MIAGNFFSSSKCLTAVLFLCLLSGLAGCAQKSQNIQVEVPVSEKADASYNFLVYQNYLMQFEKELRSPGDSEEKLARITELQKKALEAVTRVMAESDEPFLYTEKAALYWTLNQIPEAREVIKNGLDRYPEDRQLTLALASSYLNENRYPAAEVTLKNYLNKKPKDYEVRHKMAQIYLEQKKFAQALDTLKGIPAKYRNPEILYSYAKASFGLGLNRQAIKNLKLAVKKAPNFIEAWGELAYLYEYQKDYDSAEKIYTHMLELGGTPIDIRQRLISLSLKLNNPDRALSLVLEGPHQKSFLLEAVRAFMHNRFYAQASTVLDILAQWKPIPADYYFFKAAVAFEGEQAPEKALEYLGNIPKDSFHYNQSLEFRAHLLFALNRQNEALEVLRQGQEKFPHKPEFFTMEASIYMDSDDLATAQKIISRGLKENPQDTDLLFQNAVLRDKLGHTDEALKIMEKIISANPDHAMALNYVGYTLASEGMQLDRAVVLLSRANKLEPDNPYIMDSLAWAYFKTGKKEEAWKEIRKAVSQADEEAEVWEHYGDIARSLGKIKAARRGYLNALKYGSEKMDEIQNKLNSL